MSSVKKNFIYNIIYQILNLVLPLITVPYVARIIGVEGQGIYAYTSSIVQYFALFSMMGLLNYGNRTIAKNKDDKAKLSKEFCSIYALQVIASVIVIFSYIVYIITFAKDYKIYLIFQTIYLLASLLDINWFFFGLEKFKITVTRNIIIKIISIICIFLFVKTKEDLILYIVIMNMGLFLAQISLWLFVKREVDFVKISAKDIKKHIKPNLILFIPVIAISIYKLMDKIMLGNMSTIENVGYYENAERIVTTSLAFITALGNVMLPRISNLVAKGKKEEINIYINKTMEFVMFLAIPIAFGILAIGRNFAPVFLGENFVMTGYIMQYLSITIIFISWANVIRTQYLIPNERDKSYIVSVFLGAVVNLLINIILIPKYQAIGAAIGTCFAEMTVMMYQTYVVRKELEIRRYLRYLISFLVKGLVMFITVKALEIWIKDIYLLLIMQISIGIIVYTLLNCKYIMANVKLKSSLNKN